MKPAIKNSQHFQSLLDAVQSSQTVQDREQSLMSLILSLNQGKLDDNITTTQIINCFREIAKSDLEKLDLSKMNFDWPAICSKVEKQVFRFGREEIHSFFKALSMLNNRRGLNLEHKKSLEGLLKKTIEPEIEKFEPKDLFNLFGYLASSGLSLRILSDESWEKIKSIINSNINSLSLEDLSSLSWDIFNLEINKRHVNGFDWLDICGRINHLVEIEQFDCKDIVLFFKSTSRFELNLENHGGRTLADNIDWSNLSKKISKKNEAIDIVEFIGSLTHLKINTSNTYGVDLIKSVDWIKISNYINSQIDKFKLDKVDNLFFIIDNLGLIKDNNSELESAREVLFKNINWVEFFNITLDEDYNLTNFVAKQAMIDSLNYVDLASLFNKSLASEQILSFFSRLSQLDLDQSGENLETLIEKIDWQKFSQFINKEIKQSSIFEINSIFSAMKKMSLTKSRYPDLLLFRDINWNEICPDSKHKMEKYSAGNLIKLLNNFFDLDVDSSMLINFRWEQCFDQINQEISKLGYEQIVNFLNSIANIGIEKRKTRKLHLDEICQNITKDFESKFEPKLTNNDLVKIFNALVSIDSDQVSGNSIVKNTFDKVFSKIAKLKDIDLDEENKQIISRAIVINKKFFVANDYDLGNLSHLVTIDLSALVNLSEKDALFKFAQDNDLNINKSSFYSSSKCSSLKSSAPGSPLQALKTMRSRSSFSRTSSCPEITPPSTTFSGADDNKKTDDRVLSDYSNSSEITIAPQIGFKEEIFPAVEESLAGSREALPEEKKSCIPSSSSSGRPNSSSRRRFQVVAVREESSQMQPTTGILE